MGGIGGGMNSGKKIIIGTAVCLLALGSGLFNWKNRHVQADTIPEMAEWLKVFPQYPRMLDGIPLSLGDEVMVNGLPMQTAYIRTDDNLRQIVSFYQGVWRSRGFDPQLIQQDAGEAVVSIQDMENKRYLSVIVIDQGTERVIMPTINHLPEIDDQGHLKGQFSDNVFSPPVPPGSMPYHSQEMVSEGLGAATKIYQVAMSLPEVLAFYHKVMPQFGFKLERVDNNDNLDMLFFVAGKVSVNVALNAMQEAPPVTMIALTYLEEP